MASHIQHLSKLTKLLAMQLLHWVVSAVYNLKIEENLLQGQKSS